MNGEIIFDAEQGKNTLFFARQQKILTDYAQEEGFSFKPGDGWAIDIETGEVTYDSIFFEQKGYTEGQALFAALHELEHFVDRKRAWKTKDRKKIYDQERKSCKQSRARDMLGNIIDDIHDNTRVIATFPALQGQVKDLYRDKLFPKSDFIGKPRHIQFAYTLLREVMLPYEECLTSSEVRAAIDRLKSIPGKSGESFHDVISMIADERTTPDVKWRLLQKYIEPEFQDLLEKDKEDEKEKNNEQDEGGGQENGNGPHQDDGHEKRNERAPQQDEQDSSEGLFDKYNDEYEEKFPQMFDDEEGIAAVVEKSLDSSPEEDKKDDDLSERIQAGYAAEHGVSAEDVRKYREEFEKIEPFIEPLRKILKDLIADRSIPRRKLGKVDDEGVMIAPGMEAQAYLDGQSGVASKVLLDYEGKEVIEPVVGSFRFRLICDLSTSMKNGDRLIVQRRVAQLVLEVLNELVQDLEKSQSSIEFDLDIQSEIITFGSAKLTRVVKPLSSELSENQRIEVFKALSTTAGMTPDYDALKIVKMELLHEMEQNPDLLSQLNDGEVREIVIVLSDGQSDDTNEVQTLLQFLRNLGGSVKGIGMTQEAHSIISTYAPDAEVCKDIQDLPLIFQKLVEQVLSSLFVHK